MASYEETLAQLIGPGGPFEVVEDHVLGERMPVFKDRKRSLRQLLDESAGQGDKDYLVLDDRRITYAEHRRLVAALARRLAEQHGIGKGDRIAILAENHPEWVMTFWAAVSLGAVVVALNGWWTADEIAYGLELTTPKLLVVDAKRRGRVAADPGMPVLEIERDFPALLADPGDVPLPTTPIAEDDPAVILFTSGTTGRPKGAVNTHRGIIGFVQVAFLRGFAGMMHAASTGAGGDAPPATCSLVTVPLFHLSGLYAGAVMMLAVGAKTVWRLGRFEPEAVLQLIEREHVTSWAGLGAMAPRVLFHPKIDQYDLSSMRNFGSGGAPTSPTLQARMREVAPNGKDGVGLGYGSSETVTAVAMIGGEELAAHPTSVGRPQPTHRIEIRDAAGAVLPEGEQGEIHVRSPYNMLEYWGDPAATAKTLVAGRWLATGDIGYLRDGRLYINSRARDLILRGAENVYPVEIEHRLEEHPAVAECAVVGVEHAELGQEVKAIVVPREGATVDPDALARFCGETLAPFKVPTQWEVRAAPLPRNAAGKVLKTVLTGQDENRFVED